MDIIEKVTILTDELDTIVKVVCPEIRPSTIPESFKIKLGDNFIKMVLIPENTESGVAPFYISETPITIEQYREVSQAPAEFLDLYQEIWVVEYKDFTIVSAITVENVMHFFKDWPYSLPISLPSRKQWLNLVNYSYDKVKWYEAAKYIGKIKSKRIEWEMISNNSFGIYCLLGINMATKNKEIKGNNFPIGVQRDRIAFRIVCSTENAIQFLKLL